MALIQTRENKLGNVLKAESLACHGYSRKLATVTLTPTSQIGDVLADTAGVYGLVAVATTGGNLGILIDAEVYAKRPETGTANVEVAILVRDAIVVKEQLAYGADVDTDAEKDAVVATLEAQGIVVRQQV